MSRGRFHKTKLSVCFCSTWKKTYAQRKNKEKSYNLSSEKFHLIEFSVVLLPLTINPRSLSSAMLLIEEAIASVPFQRFVSTDKKKNCRRRLFLLTSSSLFLFHTKMIHTDLSPGLHHSSLATGPWLQWPWPRLPPTHSPDAPVLPLRKTSKKKSTLSSMNSWSRIL